MISKKSKYRIYRNDNRTMILKDNYFLVEENLSF